MSILGALLLFVVLAVVVYWLLREYAQLWNFPWRRKREPEAHKPKK